MIKAALCYAPQCVSTELQHYIHVVVAVHSKAKSIPPNNAARLGAHKSYVKRAAVIQVCDLK